VAASPATERRPCINCGEPLYTTEITCWKCGTAQTRPAAVAGAPAAAPGPTPTVLPPAGPAAPPPPYAPRPPAPYARPAVDYGPSPEAVSRGNTALILGILSFFCLSCILGPAAIWMGSQARREGAGGTATAGMVLGIISTSLSVILGIIYAIAMAVAGAGSSGPSPTP
jgi:hypothetical protein